MAAHRGRALALIPLFIALTSVVSAGNSVSEVAIQDQFEKARTGEQLPEAEVFGEALVNEIQTTRSATSPELVPALNQVARVQEELEQFEKAKQNYDRSIELIEEHEGQYSATLLEPLLGRSRILTANGDHANAVEELNRANHIIHRRDGVLSLAQIEVLDWKTENFMQMGEMDEADREQDFAYRLTRRKYGAGSMEMVSSLYKIADWYAKTDRYPTSVKIYKRALGILERELGEDSLALVEPLKAIAQSRRSQVQLRSEGARVLRRALDILENDDAADPNELIATYIDLGDMYTLINADNKALHYYKRAWDEIHKYDNANEVINAIFSEPVELHFPNLVLADDYRRRGRYEGYYIAQFSIGADGRAEDVRIVDSKNTDAAAHRLARNLIYRARFRPRMVEGEPMITEDVVTRRPVAYIFGGETTHDSTEQVVEPLEVSPARTRDW